MMLSGIISFLSLEIKTRIYKSMVRPILMYGTETIPDTTTTRRHTSR